MARIVPMSIVAAAGVSALVAGLAWVSASGPKSASAPSASRSFSPPQALVAPAEPKLVREPMLVRGPAVGQDRPILVTVRQDDGPLLRPKTERKAKSEGAGDRYEIARMIQRELVRVGCYGGDPDGDWGGASKRAMQVFLDRVNATLPFDEPDPVLLALAKSQKGAVCSETCRKGEAVGTDGRCIPTALIAQRTESRPTSIGGSQQAWQTDVSRVAPPSSIVADATARPTSEVVAPIPGRMALGAAAVDSTVAPQTALVPPVTRPQPPEPPKVASSPRPKSKSTPNWARSVFPDFYVAR
jgi:hypothetical protein